MALGSNTLRTSLPFLLQVMTGHLMLWFQPISYPFSHSHFEGSVDAEILPWLLQLLVPVHPLHLFHSLLPLKKSLFSSLWMRCGHSLCGRLSFSSSSFMDNVSFFSTLAFHICILLYHHHPHHLSSLLCLYLDTPTYHLLLYVLLFSTIWMVIMLLDYVFVLDDMDLFWLFVMDYMDFLMLMDIFELMCLYCDFDDWKGELLFFLMMKGIII